MSVLSPSSPSSPSLQKVLSGSSQRGGLHLAVRCPCRHSCTPDRAAVPEAVSHHARRWRTHLATRQDVGQPRDEVSLAGCGGRVLSRVLVKKTQFRALESHPTLDTAVPVRAALAHSHCRCLSAHTSLLVPGVCVVVQATVSELRRHDEQSTRFVATKTRAGALRSRRSHDCASPVCRGITQTPTASL